MSTLDELIDRLETAEGSDRELDALVALAAKWRPEWLARSEGDLWLDKSGHEPVIRFKDHCIKRRSSGNPPAGAFPEYTSSIDAAVTLVPAGFAWQATRENFGRAEVWSRDGGRLAEKVDAITTHVGALCVRAADRIEALTSAPPAAPVHDKGGVG